MVMNLHLYIFPGDEIAEHCGDKRFSETTIKEIITTRFHELSIGRIKYIDLTIIPDSSDPSNFIEGYYHAKLYFEEWYENEKTRRLQARLLKNPFNRIILEERKNEFDYSCSFWWVAPMSDSGADCGAGIGL